MVGSWKCSCAWSHLVYFLQQIIPVADDCDGKMVIHPDDLLFSTLGLLRVLSTANDLQYLVDLVPSLNNGLWFCTGSFGVWDDNDLPEMGKQFVERINFIHLHSTTHFASFSTYYYNK